MEVDAAAAGTVAAVEGVRLHEWPDFSYQYMGINLRHPFLKDRRVRQALAYAVDRQALVRDILGGHGTVLDAPIMPASWAWSPDAAGYAHDPLRARRLLAEAGWTDAGGDGLLEKDGEPFRVFLLYPAGDRERALVARRLQEDLRRVGVDLQPEVLDPVLLAERVFQRREFDLYLLGWGLGADPDATAVWRPASRWNATRFDHASNETLLSRGVRSWNRRERREIYAQWARLLSEELPYLFLYSRHRLVAVSEDIHGAHPGPGGLTADIHLWWTGEGVPEPAGN